MPRPFCPSRPSEGGSLVKADQSRKPAPHGKLLKAGELARQTGLTRQALHQYVLLGLLEAAEMTQGGQRLYAKDAVKRVNLIRGLCVTNRYTLGEVRDIFFKKGEN